jgi:hypothetical protein
MFRESEAAAQSKDPYQRAQIERRDASSERLGFTRKIP